MSTNENNPDQPSRKQTKVELFTDFLIKDRVKEDDFCLKEFLISPEQLTMLQFVSNNTHDYYTLIDYILNSVYLYEEEPQALIEFPEKKVFRALLSSQLDKFRKEVLNEDPELPPASYDSPPETIYTESVPNSDGSTGSAGFFGPMSPEREYDPCRDPNNYTISEHNKINVVFHYLTPKQTVVASNILELETEENHTDKHEMLSKFVLSMIVQNYPERTLDDIEGVEKKPSQGPSI